MTFYSGGLLVNWGRETRGNRGKRRVLLSRGVPLNKKVLLGKRVIF